MSVRLLDRLTRQLATPDRRPVALGRFVVAPDSGGARVNGLEVSDYDPLVPDARARWHVEAPGVAGVADGRFRAEDLPTTRQQQELALVVDDQMLDRVATTGEQLLLALEDPHEERAWEREHVRSLKLRLPNLERVLCAPESDIGEHQTVLRASRVRRAAPGAVDYLARHSADWNRVAFGRPVPERLLAIETSDNFDIYENRLALHTRDEIERQLRQRSESRKGEARILADLAERLRDEALDHRVRRRFARLLGSQESFAAAASAVEERSLFAEMEADDLDQLATQLHHLASAPLSLATRSLDKRRVSDFHLVNRLAVHRDYREVGVLFSQWVAGRSLDDYEDEDLDGGWRRALRRYDAYVALLVCQALRQLRLDPHDGAELERGGPPLAFELNQRSVRTPDADAATPTITLRWANDGTLHVDRVIVEAGCSGAPPVAADPIVRIVGLLGGGVRRDVLEEELATLRHGGDQDVRPLCVVTSDGSDDDAGWAPLPDRGPFVLTASPHAIDAAEHMLRLLRRLLWEPAYAGYPHDAEVDAAVGETLLPRCRGWLSRRSAAHATVSSVRITIHGAVPMSLHQLSSLVHQAVDEAHGGWRPRERARRADAVLRTLLRARAWHGWWAMCPLCGGAPAHDHHGDFADDYFRYRCSSCSSRWAVLRCECGRRTGIIEPAGSQAHDLTAQSRRVAAPHGDLIARRLLHSQGDQWLCERCFLKAVQDSR
jgi:hypothetical protein